MLLNTVPSFVCMCMCVCVCVCVLLLTVFSSCVSFSTRLKQFLLFTLNDTSDLSCFSETRQLYRGISS